MRKLIDIILEAEAAIETRFPKASARIAYSEDGDEADVFVRPSSGTVLKCIGGYDARAIIYDDGVLVIWHQGDMYHQDVYEHPQTKRPNDFLTLKLVPPGRHRFCVSVKGDADEDDEVEFTNPNWLSVLHGNRALRTVYGDISLLILLIGGEMIIEEGAFIDPSCTVISPHGLILRRGAYLGPETFIDATGGVEIGEHVRMSFRGVIMSNTHHISRSVYRRSQPGDRHRKVIIERGCWIGAHVTIYPGVIIREGCVINAGSIIMHSTEPNGLYRPAGAIRIKDLDLD